jgi:RloB-like protein
MPSKSRRDTDLRRRVNTREQRRSVLIMTNGKETEFDYFNALRDEPWITAHVQVKFKNGGPAVAVLRAATFRDEEEYDEAWAVCDVDTFDVKQALAHADAHEVGLTLSVPCFEVWLILHLSVGCPGFNNAVQADAHLRKLLPTWDKTALSFDDFRAGVFDATARAKRLEDPPDANPSTAIWRLIDSLRGS